MKQILFGLAAIGLSFSTMAQQAPLPCGTDLQRQHLIATNPDYVQYLSDLQVELRMLMEANKTERDSNTVYMIPIVFHIIHLNGEENISNEQIFDAIAVLNRDFAALNADTTSVHPAFADIIGDAKIQFQLPTIDPLGNCTNGINRIKSTQTFLGEGSSKYQPWPRFKYLNIWITKAIASGAAGYFQGFPNFADGILILHDYVGRNGPAGQNWTGGDFRSRAITHEVGHYFDLNHVWGENNGVPENAPAGHMQATCGDDGVDDTPITRGWNFCAPLAQRADCDRQSMRNTIYNFDDVTTSSGSTDPSAVINALDSIDFRERATFSPISANGVSANSTVNGKFAFSNWGTGANQDDSLFTDLTGSIDPNKYYEVSVSPVITDLISVSGIDFKVDRNTNGVRTFAVRTSVNNFATNLPINVNSETTVAVQTGNVIFFKTDATGQTGTLTVTVPASGHTNSSNPLTFRIYAWNSEASSGTFVVDDVVVKGVVGRIENVENYMEYSYCSYMFTDGQVARMRAMAESTIAQRSSLWTNANLQNTGVAAGYEFACGPLADFYAVVGQSLISPVVPFTPTTCPETQVRFVDNSSRAFPDQWSWTFQDGTPATSTARNPVVTFVNQGWKTVTLTASNANGSDTKSDTYAVYIGGNEITAFGDYSEGFENGISPYFNQNYSNNHTSFQWYNQGGLNSPNCVYLNSGDRNQVNFIDPTNAGDYDELITPGFDLSYFQSAQFSFWYSYSTSTTNIDTVTERLELYSSRDCGRTWSLRTNINGSAIVTNGNQTNGPGGWVQKSVAMPGTVLARDVMFKFRFISSEFSNNLYIDNINISGPVGIEALDSRRLLNVYPNPSNDRFTVQAFGMDAYRTQVTVTDMRGAVVYNKSLAPTGDNGIQISSQELGMSNGLYILRVSNEVGTSTQKLTVGQ